MMTDSSAFRLTQSDGSLALHVFRDFAGKLEAVGTLSASPSASLFQYDETYLRSATATSISLSLPLQAEPFSDRAAPAFFEGLLPEGSLRSALARATRTDESFHAGLLARLNNESIGGLLFELERNASKRTWAYRPLESEELASFAEEPARIAIDLSTSSRLSLSGAQSKIGLYHHGSDPASGWHVPEGSAPSNMIVKASSGTFPLQTVNEAFCLAVARRCGFDVASARLIPMPNREPLLAVRRFDRIEPKAPFMVGGLPAPVRLHQEDFCQAAGLPSHFKYEPTDGRYLALGARLISRASENPFGDKMMLFNSVLFDYLIGNCDNHLKNRSLLWREDWSARELSPLYDITCTTWYPALDREMGVALCESRRIDDVTAQDIRMSAKSMGMSEALGWEQYLALRKEFEAALPAAEREIADQGFPEVAEIARFIERDSAPRRSL
ncbi:HipA domain-containing protein [Rubneribacter sp.]|nr:HipA domain-containing protein [Candidatus Rubneribacter avistercoris]